MIKKFLIVLLGILCLVNITTAASNGSVFYLPDIDNTATIEYLNLVKTQFITSETDGITKLYLKQENAGSNGNSSLLINFDHNLTYQLDTVNYYEYQIFGYGGIPYTAIRQRVHFQNYTVFNSTKIYTNWLWSTIRVEYIYDSNTGLSSFAYCNKFNTCAVLPELKEIQNETSYVTSVFTYSQNTLISSTTKYDLELTYSDIVTEQIINSKKSSLSGLSSIIYGILNGIYKTLTLNINAELTLLIDILLLLDSLFWLLGFVLLVVVFYPYLIFVWIIIIGVGYVTWKSTTIREMLFNFKDYFTAIGELVQKAAIVIWDYILRIIALIRG